MNGHGGNRGPLITPGVEEGVEALSYWELVAGDRLLELFPFDLGSVGHAGEFETSVMLEAFADRVGDLASSTSRSRSRTPPRARHGRERRARRSARRNGRSRSRGADEVVAALVVLLDGDAWTATRMTTSPDSTTTHSPPTSERRPHDDRTAQLRFLEPPSACR